MRQGTVTPTHFNVICDTSGLKPDHMQRMTYKLCHLYYNWPVRIFLSLEFPPCISPFLSLPPGYCACPCSLSVRTQACFPCGPVYPQRAFKVFSRQTLLPLTVHLKSSCYSRITCQPFNHHQLAVHVQSTCTHQNSRHLDQ